MGNIFFAIAAVFYNILLFFVYFSRKRINTSETRVYSHLLTITTVMNIISILAYYTITYRDFFGYVNIIVSRLLLVCYMLWILIFTLYMICISDDAKDKPEKKIYMDFLISVFFLLSLIVFVLPISFKNVFSMVYSYGPAANVVYLFSGFMAIVWLIVIIKNIRRISDKRYLPTFVLIILVALAYYLNQIRPDLILLSYLLSSITFLMYYTIENPDVRMIKQLENANEQVEKANKTKSEFLSGVSYEIRTSLNTIVGLSEDTLIDKDNLSESAIENAKDIIGASKGLLEIIDDILEMNKIEANNIEIASEPYDLRKLANEFYKVANERIGSKKIAFNINLDENIPYELIGDEDKLRIIISNLVTNAIKYTEEGHINLGITCSNNLNNNTAKVIITCQDTGSGITAEEKEHLFTKFEQLGEENRISTERTGLGLSITKSIIEMMGGTINIESTVGKGSLFIVSIPQEIHILTKPIVEDEIGDIKSSNIIYNNRRILIVDDNKLNIKVAKKVLSSFNFIIDECYDGEECLEKINAGNKYDLIFMDIMMPHMNGEVTLQKLKEIQNFNTPVVALTADAVVGSREKYLGEGFDDYIAKPFTKAQIKEKLDIIFEFLPPVRNETIIDEEMI